MAEETKSKSPLQYATLRGSSPWALAMTLAFFIVSWRFDYIQTAPDWSVQGLRTNTLYLVQHALPLCRGDVVRFGRTTHNAAGYRKVAALGPSVFQLVDGGYRIKTGDFDEVTAMDTSWMEAARRKLGGKSLVQVPAGKVLIVNTELGRKLKKNAWPFKLIPTKRIRRKITRTLLSRDISRIGASMEGDCGSGAAS